MTASTSIYETKNFQQLKKANERAREKTETLQKELKNAEIKCRNLLTMWKRKILH